MTEGVLACRPVELDPTDKLDRVVLEQTFVYDGSVQGVCSACGRAVWIGPRGQAAMDDPSSDVVVACFYCAAPMAAVAPMLSLGNPQPNPNRSN